MFYGKIINIGNLIEILFANAVHHVSATNRAIPTVYILVFLLQHALAFMTYIELLTSTNQNREPVARSRRKQCRPHAFAVHYHDLFIYIIIISHLPGRTTAEYIDRAFRPKTNKPPAIIGILLLQTILYGLLATVPIVRYVIVPRFRTLIAQPPGF